MKPNLVIKYLCVISFLLVNQALYAQIDKKEISELINQLWCEGAEPIKHKDKLMYSPCAYSHLGKEDFDLLLELNLLDSMDVQFMKTQLDSLNKIGIIKLSLEGWDTYDIRAKSLKVVKKFDKKGTILMAIPLFSVDRTKVIYHCKSVGKFSNYINTDLYVKINGQWEFKRMIYSMTAD
jgi:hypothetical protein